MSQLVRAIANCSDFVMAGLPAKRKASQPDRLSGTEIPLGTKLGAVLDLDDRACNKIMKKEEREQDQEEEDDVKAILGRKRMWWWQKTTGKGDILPVQVGDGDGILWQVLKDPTVSSFHYCTPPCFSLTDVCRNGSCTGETTKRALGCC